MRTVYEELQAWFRAYRDCMLTSEPGKCIPHLYRFARAYNEPSFIDAARQLEGWEKVSAYTRITMCQEHSSDQS